MARRSNTEVLQEFLSLEGMRVLDVGSGAGALVRYMTRKGAIVTGLECGAAQLEKARATEPEGGEEYVEGFGQDMPFDDCSYDAVVFFNSLHHIPGEVMGQALNEAKRVVRPGGLIYVAEPVAEGPSFELHAPIDDETEVRALADNAVARAASEGLSHIRRVEYDTAYHYTNYEEVREEGIRIDPSRLAAFVTHDTLMRTTFDRLGVLEDKGYRFDQPMLVNVLQKPAQD